MTPEEAPVGSIVVVGNPLLGKTATKQGEYWTYNDIPGQIVGYDDLHKASRLVFNPQNFRFLDENGRPQ